MEEILRHLQRASAYSLDLETTGLDPLKDRIIGVALAAGENAWWIPFTGDGAYPFRETWDALALILLDTEKVCWIQNAMFDLQFLWVNEVRLLNKLGDSMVAAYLLDENRTKRKGALRLKGENGLVAQEFDVVLPEYKHTQLAGDLFGKPTDEYARDDAHWCLKVGKKLEGKLEKDGLSKIFWDLEMPVLPVLAEMELSGVQVDLKRMWELRKKYDAEAQRIEKRIQEIAKEPIIASSPEQMSRLLFGKLGLKPKPDMVPSAKGVYSTAEDIVAEYTSECEAADLLIQFREAAGFRDRYLEPLIKLASDDPDRRVRTHLQRAETGRLRSSDPNLQNIPKDGDIKSGFVAPEGCVLICADYNQLELRLMAHQSQDPKMLLAYQTGGDIHTQTQTGLQIPDRKTAKETNFGLIYGMGAERFQFQLWRKARIKKTLEECTRWRYGFFELYSGIRRYHKKVQDFLEENGYVRTICGRKRHLKRWVKLDESKAERIAVNFTIQGTAADLILLAMRNLQRTLNPLRQKHKEWAKVRQVLQVHDELVVEAPKVLAEEAKAMVKSAMEDVIKLSVPLIADVGMGETWAASKGK